MSRLNRLGTAICSIVVVSSLLLSASVCADESAPMVSNSTLAVKTIPTSKHDTVASFIKRLDPAVELAAGAALMALRDHKVVGAYTTDTGIFLVLASIFDLGDEVKKLAASAVPSLTEWQAHLTSASILYIGGKKIYQTGAPTTAIDFASIFFRASAANQISATIQSYTATSPNSVLEVAVLVPTVAFAFGPFMGNDVKSNNFHSQFYKSLVINSAYRAKDFFAVAASQIGCLSEAKSQMYVTHLATTAAYIVMQYLPADTAFGLISDHLVEASFFGLTLFVSQPIMAAASIGSFILTSRQPQNRLLAQASSGLRQGFAIFSIAPALKSFLPWAYQSAVSFANQAREEKEL